MIQVIRELHSTPTWASQRLTRAGGFNRFGEPNFRVTWEKNLLDWIGGLWEDRDPHGRLIREVCEMRYLPKYPWLANRWIIEQWLPPESFGSPESWYKSTKEWGGEGNIAQLGPYPSRGRYAFLCVLDTKSGGFIQLTSTLLDEVIVALRRKKEMQTLAALKEAQATKERLEMIEAREYLADGTPAFYGEESVSVL